VRCKKELAKMRTAFLRKPVKPEVDWKLNRNVSLQRRSLDTAKQHLDYTEKFI